MPASASSQQNTRSAAKARPSANVRAANLIANTPVLFRLPAITDIPARRPPVGSDDAVLPEAAGTKVAAVPIAAVQSAPQLMPAPTVKEKYTTAEPELAQQPLKAEERSWWEHWSSGVVLILLLIALATASILAIQRSNHSRDPKWMADKEEFPTHDSLSGINIDAAQPASAGQGMSSHASAVDKDRVNNQPTSAAVETEPLSLSLGLEPANTTPVSSTPDPQATVSLQPPVIKSTKRLPLFNESATGESMNNNVPAIQTSTETSKPAADSGSKFWNSSSSNGSQPTLQFSDPESLSSADFGGQNSRVGASLTTSRKESNVQESSLSQSSIPQDAQTSISPQTGAPSQGLMTTSTPEFPREALLRTFQQFKAEPATNRYPQPNINPAGMSPTTPTQFNATVPRPTGSEPVTTATLYSAPVNQNTSYSLNASNPIGFDATLPAPTGAGMPANGFNNPASSPNFPNYR